MFFLLTLLLGIAGSISFDSVVYHGAGAVPGAATVHVAGEGEPITPHQFAALMIAQAQVLRELAGNEVLQAMPSGWLRTLQKHREEASLFVISTNTAVSTRSCERSDSHGSQQEYTGGSDSDESGLDTEEEEGRHGLGQGGMRRRCGRAAPDTIASEVSAWAVTLAIGEQLVSVWPTQQRVSVGGGLVQVAL